MSDIQWIARHLNIGIHNKTVCAVASFSEDERYELFELNDDGARMYLYTINTLLSHAWVIEHVWSLRHENVECKIKVTELFYITLGNHKESFTLNRYGQMQLGVWVAEHCQ